MASEGPAYTDGGQTVAAANYYNPGSALAGPNGSGQYLCVALSTSVARTSVLASVAGQQIYGILQNTPVSGEAAEVCFMGVTKAMTGSAGTTKGHAIMTDATGAVINWTSSSNKAQIGYCLETGASTQVITVVLVPTGNTVA